MSAGAGTVRVYVRSAPGLRPISWVSKTKGPESTACPSVQVHDKTSTCEQAEENRNPPDPAEANPQGRCPRWMTRCRYVRGYRPARRPRRLLRVGGAA